MLSQYPSTLLFLNQLTGVTVEAAFLQRIIATRRCPICGSDAGRMCRTLGGMPVLQRTHYQRFPRTVGGRRIAAGVARGVNQEPGSAGPI